MAHTAYPTEGLIHFDADERWTIDSRVSSEGLVNLNYVMRSGTTSESIHSIITQQVAMHEIGHSLG